jgi:CrcB protein
MSAKLLLYIAVGGALGTVGRYLSTVLIGHWLNSGLPYGTMVVNIVGSFAMGCLLSALALEWSPSQEVRSFVQVGILGAFTTFSAFSMDAYNQIIRGDYIIAAVYVVVSVIAGIVALIIGVALVRQILT